MKRGDTYDLLTLRTTRQSERCERAHGSKHVRRDDCRDFARLGVRSEKFKLRAMRYDDFLLPCAREVSNDGLEDGRRWLKGQVVKMHRGRAECEQMSRCPEQR